MIRLKFQQVMEIKFSQIGIMLFCMLSGRLFRPTFGYWGSSDARCCGHRARLILEEDRHLIEVQARFSDRWSQSASIISGVVVGFRPMRVGGAWMLPNCCKFLRIFMIVNLLHSASSAILALLSDWLSIMSRMRCSLDGGSLGAIL